MEKCGAELNSILRRPYEMLHNWDAIAVVESDLFRLLIIDAYSFMIWPFMRLGTKREIYSGNVELDVTANVQVDDFLAGLSDKNKQILKLRMEGLTLEVIAKELGFQNHSGALKRIRKIGKLYDKYSGEDFVFSEKKIVTKVE